MSNQEQLTIEQIDRQAVNETIADIQTYLQIENDSRQHEAYTGAVTFIDSLYEQYTPDMPVADRMYGKLLGAVGLARAELRYGKDEFSPHIYGGSYEDQVIATYHHANHPRGFIANAFRYATAVNQRRPGTYDREAFIRIPVIGAYHDAIMGNGRGNDERQSARLATELMTKLGFTLLADTKTTVAIDATTWDDELKKQSVNEQKPHLEYQRLGAVPDLLPIFDRRGPYEGICVLIEDMSKRLHDQILTREAGALGMSLVGVTIDDCLQLVDQSPVLREKYGRMLAGQIPFYESFKPGDPDLDQYFPGRGDNIVLLREVSDAYNAGRLSAHDTLLVTREYMAKGGQGSFAGQDFKG
ncbi:MAG TPA: hypothetical protein VFT16_05530 [Candidatus Saccharimonadales bacterium]|nr:hypothetical protein [Candidatus Saccharimonadales bacterium]